MTIAKQCKGFLLQALVDNGKCDWHHLLHDSVEREKPHEKRIHRLNLPQVLVAEFSPARGSSKTAIKVSSRTYNCLFVL